MNKKIVFGLLAVAAGTTVQFILQQMVDENVGVNEYVSYQKCLVAA